MLLYSATGRRPGGLIDVSNNPHVRFTALRGIRTERNLGRNRHMIYDGRSRRFFFFLFALVDSSEIVEIRK